MPVFCPNIVFLESHDKLVLVAQRILNIFCLHFLYLSIQVNKMRVFPAETFYPLFRFPLFLNILVFFPFIFAGTHQGVLCHHFMYSRVNPRAPSHRLPGSLRGYSSVRICSFPKSSPNRGSPVLYAGCRIWSPFFHMLWLHCCLLLSESPSKTPTLFENLFN